VLENFRRAKGVVVLLDADPFAHLRSLPLLHFLRFSNFTYPGTWRNPVAHQVDFPSYTYVNSTGVDLENLPDKLVVMTTQNWELKYPRYTIRPLIDFANR